LALTSERRHEGRALRGCHLPSLRLAHRRDPRGAGAEGRSI